MKKLFSIFTILALLLPVLAGCHGSVKREEFKIENLPEFDSSKTYELTFWAKNDTNQTQIDIYNKAIADFEALYPNIKIKLRAYNDYGKIYQDVITNISTDTTPNICITYPDHIATYLSGQNVVVPLDDLMADSRYGLGGSELKFDGPDNGEIIPQFLEEGKLYGKQYALPYMRSTEACYINKDFVEKLGYTIPDVLTWDFVWEVSNAARAKDASGNFLVNGQKTMLPFIYKSTDNMMIQMTEQLGSGYATESGEIQLFNEATKAILYTIADNTKSRAFNTFHYVGYPANFLNAGQCVFAIDSTAGATWMGCDAPLVDIPEDKMVKFETVVRPIPQFDPSKPTMISQGPSMCIFNKQDPQEVLASWLFMQFLLTNEVQIAYAQTEGYVPVTGKAQQTEEYQTYLSNAGCDTDLHYSVKLDATKLLLDNTQNTFVTPVYNGSTDLRSASGHLIESVVKSVRTGETVDDAYMQRLFSDTVSLYHLDEKHTPPTDADTTGDDQQSDVADTNSGPLPSASVILLISLGVIWVLIGIYAIYPRIKRK